MDTNPLVQGRVPLQICLRIDDVAVVTRPRDRIVMEYISSLLDSLMGSEDASYCIVGCGMPGRGMGWYHGFQLVNGEIGACVADLRIPSPSRP